MTQSPIQIFEMIAESGWSLNQSLFCDTLYVPI